MEKNPAQQGARFSEPNMKDLMILELIKAGDSRLFSHIHSKYKPYIRQYVYERVYNQKMTEDLVQDIMTKIWTNLYKYRVDHTFNSWVWTLVRNHMVDHHRRTKTTVLSTKANYGISCEDLEVDQARERMVVLENAIEDAGRADDRLNERQLKEFVKSLLGSVNARERRILEMFFFEEKSYAEIAEELQVPLGTMKVLLLRVKEKLRGNEGIAERARAILA